MLELHDDFSEYLAQIRRARKRTLAYFLLALTLTITLSLLFLGLANRSQSDDSTIMIWLSDPGNALDFILVPFNIVVASVARYWYLRQDKLMTLLTQAMVIEQENEMAIRLLLTKKIRK